MRYSKLIIAVAALIPLLVWVACDDDDNGLNNPSDETTVMFINGSPDPERVEVLVDGVKEADALGFRENTVYQTVDAGDHVLTVQLENQPTPVLDSLDVTLSGLEVYSVFVGDTGTETSLLLLQDELNSPDDTGLIRVRFVHLSPNAGNVDLRSVTTDSIIGNAQNVGYLEGTTFEQERDGQRQFKVVSTVTDSSLAISPLAIYEGGKIYTVYLTGYVGGFGDEALMLDRLSNQ